MKRARINSHVHDGNRLIDKNYTGIYLNFHFNEWMLFYNTVENSDCEKDYKV